MESATRFRTQRWRASCPKNPSRKVQAEFARWYAEMWSRCQSLKVGDEIRIVRMPSWIDEPWFNCHADTRRLFKKLLARKRPLKFFNDDLLEGPWIRYRFRGRNGRMEHHSLLVNDDSWVKVKKRVPRDN